MGTAILLAVAASFCTATASVSQRIGARSSETAHFDVWLVLRLARRPVWLLGLVSMILGFAFQLSAHPSCLPAGYQAQAHREQVRELHYQPVGAPGAGTGSGAAGSGDEGR
jgi:hypothetical protein